MRAVRAPQGWHLPPALDPAAFARIVRRMDGPAQTIGKMTMGEAESPYAWVRLATSLVIGTIGSVGMWAVVVTLPAVQAEFGVARADASLPYTLAMVGFGARHGRPRPAGGPSRHRPAPDRRDPDARPRLHRLGLAPTLVMFALANLLIGAGSAATFAPLIADISHWFTRRLGIAVGICASGNYLGGAVWPPDRAPPGRCRGLAPDPDRHRRRRHRRHAAAAGGAAAQAGSAADAGRRRGRG